MTGHFDTEGSYWFEEGIESTQQDEGFATSVEPEFYWSLDGGNQAFLFAPFIRADKNDTHRSHIDIRELYWQMAGGFWELKIGLGKIFWGVTETQHVVDIINQTDILEGTDGEDKFGQPMINLNLIPDFGSLGIYILPGHRHRLFPGPRGRFRPTGIMIDDENPEYETELEEYNPDFAIRWFQTLGQFDYGLSYFIGNSREPSFIPSTFINPTTNTTQMNPGVFLPYYSFIHQAGLELQYIIEALIVKGEGVTRIHDPDEFFTSGDFDVMFDNVSYTLTTGFEYTFSNVMSSGKDIGLLGEYHKDDRVAANPFDDDFFGGVRLALNDIQSTDVLGGFTLDRNNQTTGYFFEATRRLGERWKIEIESRGIFNADPEDVAYGFRKDDFVKLNLGFYF